MRTFLYSILCLRWKNLAAYESWDGLQLTPVTLSAGRKQVKGWKTLIKFTFAGFGPFQTFSPLIITWPKRVFITQEEIPIYPLSQPTTKPRSGIMSQRFRLCISCHVTHHVNLKKKKKKFVCTEVAWQPNPLTPPPHCAYPHWLALQRVENGWQLFSQPCSTCGCVCFLYMALQLLRRQQPHRPTDKRSDLGWSRVHQGFHSDFIMAA